MNVSEPLEKLRDMGITLEQVLAAASGAMLVLDQTGRLIWMNPAASKLTGLSPEASQGRHFLELGLLKADGECAFSDALIEAIKNGKSAAREWIISRPEQETVVEAVIVLLSAADRAPVLLLQLCDQTTLRQLEAKLRLSQRMETVGRLASGLAHDFNNVLTVIKGYAEVMLLNPNMPADMVRHIKTMGGAAERGGNLTRQLLTFSRRQIVHVKPIDLNETVSSVSQMLRRLVSESVSLQFKYSSNLPHIAGDQGMLEHLVANLLIHARDRLPHGGSVVVETGLVEQGSLASLPATDVPAETLVCLSVGNLSSAPDSAQVSRLTAAAVDDADPVLALGLGLQVACSIAEQHRAWIETAALGPTEFMCRVYFRTSAVPAPTIETPAVPQATRGGREAILVVEDEPPIRELAKSILEGYGYTVYEAGSGREALDIWEKNQGRIDLLFTDMVLPGGMSGRAVAQRLLAAKPLLKVVYTTGYSVELMQSNLVLRAGFNFLPKPYNTTMLAQAIRNCLDSPAGPQASSNAGTSQAQSDLAQNT